MNSEPKKTITIGKYAITPLSHLLHGGAYCASVSIRRGIYDRIYSFERKFQSQDGADQYAMSQVPVLMRQDLLAAHA